MVESGGVLHHGTYEEDDLVTWEALVFPRGIRSDGEPVFISETGFVSGEECTFTPAAPSVISRHDSSVTVGSQNRCDGMLIISPYEPRCSVRLLSPGRVSGNVN